MGWALGQAYGSVAGDAAALLKNTGYAVEDVGTALQSAFRAGAEDATKLLKNIGYNATDVNKALGSAFGKGADECEMRRYRKASGSAPRT
ncbi:hypothetical protein [Vitiosangium sp. GDMCC 1.1324]|uniref:hypothetical protein n=1 Tax=Vitiosangium sp. (strain GDMCC 1.1324) TaxID=2138576 RepID=UPI0011B3A753|nr:hypothetical protein [Vitiosangium sp. GDMCC 1.1324]